MLNPESVTKVYDGSVNIQLSFTTEKVDPALDITLSESDAKRLMLMLHEELKKKECDGECWETCAFCGSKNNKCHLYESSVELDDKCKHYDMHYNKTHRVGD